MTKIFSDLTFCNILLRNKVMGFRIALEKSQTRLHKVVLGYTCAAAEHNTMQSSALYSDHFQVEAVLGFKP